MVVPLENNAAYSYLGSHEEGRSKNSFGGCGSKAEQALGGRCITKIKLNDSGIISYADRNN